jgi:hypothetical protein
MRRLVRDEKDSDDCQQIEREGVDWLMRGVGGVCDTTIKQEPTLQPDTLDVRNGTVRTGTQLSAAPAIHTSTPLLPSYITLLPQQNLLQI